MDDKSQISTLNQTLQSEWAASDDDIHAALVLLRALPRRHSPDVKVLRKAFAIALDGVSCVILRAAVEAILKNSLGHAFMPSPPELRGECDRLLFEARRDLLIAGVYDELPTPEQAVAYLSVTRGY